MITSNVWYSYVIPPRYRMLEDINSPESKMLIKACRLISEIRGSFTALTSMSGEQLKSQHGAYKLTLGQLALIAEKFLRPTQREKVDRAIQLLYKPLTGQVKITESDFAKIKSIIDTLESSDCFFCGCI